MNHLFRFVLLFLLSAAQAWAAWERIGQTPSGAVYRIAVPETWRAGDDLVVYQHGLSFERDLAPDLGPLLETQLAQGYAVAASGYSQAGWAVFVSAQDNRELIERFRADVGEPGRILTYGGSMGGYIALQMAEDPQLEVAGALAMCPAAAGYRTWDTALDLRLAYDVICEGVTGGELPPAEDIPWLIPPADVTPLGLEGIVLRINRCTGVNLPEWLRSDGQRQRLAALKTAFAINSDDFLLLNLGYATLGLSDLLRDPSKLAGRVGLGNAFVDYGDDLLNEHVRRVEADPFAALDFRLRSGLRGTGHAKVISLHTDGDELVVPAHQSWLRERLPAARLTSALVTESMPTHCEFKPAEGIAAWDSLRDWVAGNTQPDAVELQARCLALADTGHADGPCRIDPTLQPDEFDVVVRPRNDAVAQVDARFSGNWYDPERSGEGWLIEVLDDQTALVYGFSYPAANAVGDQLWLLGTGVISGDGIAVEQMYSMRGGDFGTRFSSDQVSFVPWGRVHMVFGDCGSARLRFEGPDGYGSGERQLVQLLHLGNQQCDATDDDDGGPGGLSGSWYDPAQPGQGLVINARGDGLSTLTFFSYAPDSGEPVWLYGQGSVDERGHMRFEAIARPNGARFDAFDPGAVDRAAWGEIEIDFSDCDNAVLRYRGDQSDYGEGTLTLARLTKPIGLGECGL